MNQLSTAKQNDVVVQLNQARELFKGSALGQILELAILEIEQLRSDKANVASDLYAGVRR
jgi:hypothetical protein